MLEIESQLKKHIFQIEAENLWPLLAKFTETNIEVLNIYDDIRIPIHKSPYHHILSSCHVAISEDKMSLFLQLVEQGNQDLTNKIRLYKLETEKDKCGNEEQYYRPFVVIDSNIILFATTFFCQKLRNSEQFITEEARNAIMDQNYLETLTISSKTENRINGSYYAIGHMKNSEFLTGSDSGIFKVEGFQEDGRYTVVSKITNIRNIIKSYGTPYDIVFRIPNVDGPSECELTEYYVPMDNCFIHYAEDVTFVEVYGKDDHGRLNPYSVTRIQKNSPLNDFEQEVLTRIGFHSEIDNVQKRAVALNPNQIEAK